jgi:hypothetical protein
MGNLELFSYGPINQTAFNKTMHRLHLYYKNGSTDGYEWTLRDGLASGEPFSFDNLSEIKAVLTQCKGMYFIF